MSSQPAPGRRAALVVALGLSACASPPPPSTVDAAAAPVRATAAAMSATAASLLGRSAGDAAAALGPAAVVRFDSGYAVWVVRFVEPSGGDAARAPRAPSELMLLVTPAGTVAKARVRSP